MQSVLTDVIALPLLHGLTSLNLCYVPTRGHLMTLLCVVLMCCVLFPLTDMGWALTKGRVAIDCTIVTLLTTLLCLFDKTAMAH